MEAAIERSTSPRCCAPDGPRSGASDVHLSPGFPPAMRDPRARSSPLEELRPAAPPSRPATSSTASSTTTSASASRTHKQLDFAYAVPGVARFRVNCFFQRGAISAAFRLIPHEIPTLDELNLPPDPARADPEAARLRPRHGPDRLGQVDDAGGDDRRDQLASARTTSSRSRTRSSSCTATRSCIVNQREIGADADDFALGLEVRPARGPRRHPRRRDARPRDDLDGADRGRDRPPRLRHPAHPVDRPDRRPDHRRLPAPSSRSRCGCSSRSPCRGSSPSSCSRPPTAPAASSPARS